MLGLVAIAQDDLKQLLAASTCAQVGFMVLAAGVGGVAGGVMQLVAHAAVKSLLFLAAGAWLTALGTKRLGALRGAARQYPVVGVAFTVGAVALAGLPPASLWVTKDEVLAAALRHGPALYATGLAAAVVSAVYSIKALWYVWQPVPAGAAAGYDTERPGTRRLARVAAAPLVVLAVPAATLGVLALPVIAGPLDRALGAAGEPSPAWWQLTLSAVLAVAASGLTWWRARRRGPGPGGGHRLAGAMAGPGTGRAPSSSPARSSAWPGSSPASTTGSSTAASIEIARGTVALARAAARLDDSRRRRARPPGRGRGAAARAARPPAADRAGAHLLRPGRRRIRGAGADLHLREVARCCR